MLKIRPMQWYCGAVDGEATYSSPITAEDVLAINSVCMRTGIIHCKGPVKYLEPQIEPVLYIYFAPKAYRALVLRVYKHTTEMILWHTDTDTFQRGQWTLSGKLKIKSSTITDDGKYVHYKLHKNKGMLLINAISEIPYFTAKAVHNDSYAEDITMGQIPGEACNGVGKANEIPADYEGQNKLSMTSGQSVILTLADSQVPFYKCKIIADRGRIFKIDENSADYRLILDTTDDVFVNIVAPYSTKKEPSILKNTVSS